MKDVSAEVKCAERNSVRKAIIQRRMPEARQRQKGDPFVVEAMTKV